MTKSLLDVNHNCGTSEQERQKVSYLLLRLLLLGGCWWLLGDAQLGGHGCGVLAADGTAGRISDALDLSGRRGNRGSTQPKGHSSIRNLINTLKDINR